MTTQPPTDPENTSSTQTNSQSSSKNKTLLWILGVVLIIGCICALCLTVLILRPSGSTESDDTSWTAVQERGVLYVGTSADYPPFSYYNDQNQIDGFDPALIRALGAKLGVKVEVTDFAFEGLGAALEAGQVDVLAAAISVTPARQEKVDFSYIYYVGQDGILAQENADLGTITNPDQLVGLRIGVQKRSVYEDWLRETLVNTGKISEGSLFIYAQPEHAVNDLRLNRLDVVMMDLQPATAALADGGLKLVGQGLNQQRLAYAVQAGAGELLSQLNQGLVELQNDGTVTRLVGQYLGLRPEDIIPPPTPEPTEEPCSNAMQFVQDLNYDDEDLTNLPQLKPGEGFQKGWRIKNTGTCTWDSTYSLKYVRGNNSEAHMQGQPAAIEGKVEPNKTYDIYINMIAPNAPGEYIGYWQMHANNVPFGQTIWAAIEVPADKTATTSPTPEDTITPTLVPTETPIPPTEEPTAVPPTDTPVPTETPLPSDTPEPSPTERPGKELIGPTWSLEEYLPVDDPDNRELTPVVPETEIKILFDENNTVSGSFGCNTFTGRYVTDGEQILFSDFVVTQQICQTPEGIMEQEDRVLVLFDQSEEYRYEIDADEMTLTFIRIGEKDGQREEIVLMVYKGGPTPR